VQNQTHLHYASNLSQGGIFTMVHLSFNLPGNGDLEGKAKVVRIVTVSSGLFH